MNKQIISSIKVMHKSLLIELFTNNPTCYIYIRGTIVQIRTKNRVLYQRDMMRKDRVKSYTDKLNILYPYNSNLTIIRG